MTDGVDNYRPPHWMTEALAQITEQKAMVDSCPQGSNERERAKQYLVILQDNLRALVQSKNLLAQARTRLRPPQV